jgi:hypothetical protein
VSDKGSNSDIMTKALKDLLVHWERAGGSWRDKARVEFDKDYLQELLPAVRAASNAAKQIEILLEKVRSEVS